MQTLRPYVSEQDENSAPGVSVFRGEFKSGTPGMGAAKGVKVFGSSTSTAGTGVAPRRALGNITNRTPASKGLATPSAKSFGAPTPGTRRALGDITNRGTAAPSAVKQPPPPPLEQPAASNTKAAAPLIQGPMAKAHPSLSEERCRIDALAELYAKDGIEASAGWTWEEQQQRQHREARLSSWVDMYGYSDGSNGLSGITFDDPQLSFGEESDLDDTLDLASEPEELSIPESPAGSDHSLDLSPGDLDAILDALAKVDTSALDESLKEWEE